MYFMGNEINSPRRIPHAWGKEYDWLRWPPEASNASEFTDLYTKLGAVHRYNPAVWGGSYRYLNTSNNHDLFVMERKKGNNVVFVVINFSSRQISGTITDALPEGDFTEAFNGGTGPLSNVVNLPGWDYRVYVKDTPPPAQSPIKSSGKERK